MKAILMSDRPKWVAMTLNGEKIIEIRKTMPKRELPIDVYIHCTKGKHRLVLDKENLACFTGWLEEGDTELNGKVVAKFTLDVVYEYDIKDENTWIDSDFAEVMQKLSAMSLHEINEYAGNHFYAWHISDLVIFDEPKELSEFGVKRAPQSWQYIEVKE